MLLKKFFYSSVITTLFFTVPLLPNTWKLFFYMDASADLSDMAIKNITDMMRGKPNSNVDIVIQLHAYDSLALRYHVTNTGLVFLEQVALSGNCKQDFINAASWALTRNTTDHTMVIFSNHGWGALDPQWNAQESTWEVAEMGLSHQSAACTSCTEEKKCKQEHKHHKAFMFNNHTHTYLSNRELAESLEYLHENCMQHKKIDIVAFDTCMGCMLEVATCVAPYAHYLLGVQSCALRDGFDYQGLVAILNMGRPALQTATEFVAAFDTYYALHDAKGIYTCASLDMAYVGTVNEALNNVVTQLLQHPEFIPSIEQARNKTPRFCLWPIYTDLIAFCKLIETQLMQMPPCNIIDTLVKSVHTLYTAAATMVVARCGGKSTYGNAYGFSIYLPAQAMENSYLDSVFAHYSQWPNFIKRLCKG